MYGTRRICNVSVLVSNAAVLVRIFYVYAIWRSFVYALIIYVPHKKVHRLRDYVT